jgi:uncharacterized protein (DUF362 family)
MKNEVAARAHPKTAQLIRGETCTAAVGVAQVMGGEIWVVRKAAFQRPGSSERQALSQFGLVTANTHAQATRLRFIHTSPCKLQLTRR